MRKVTALLSLIGLVVFVSTAAASVTHVKASLVEVDNSGVSGFVQLHQLGHGGTNIDVHAQGLNPGTIYASFYYDNATCTSGPDAVGTFTANPGGKGNVGDEADEDLDEINSVS